MHDEGFTGRFFRNGADKIAHHRILFLLVYADAVLHRDIDVNHVLHGFQTIGNQIHFIHQTRAKRAFLHPLARTTTIKIDFVIAPLCGNLRALCQIRRI